ncbi:MAG: sulfotransferase [Pseudomonadota bacterium]
MMSLEPLLQLAGMISPGLPLPLSHRGYRRFVIAGAPRTGSTLLAERCESHPSMACFGEVLAPERVEWLRRRGPETGWIEDYRNRSIPRFLERAIWHRYPRCIRAVGLKLLYHHFLSHREALLPYLRAQPDLHVILLRRRNLLANCVSALVAHETGRYTIRDDGARPSLPRVTIAPERCEEWFRRYMLTDRLVTASFAGHPSLDLDYETLVADPEGQNERLCAFLGVEAHALRQQTVKMDPMPLSERVANFEVLRAHFAGTEWARFFEESTAQE